MLVADGTEVVLWAREPGLAGRQRRSRQRAVSCRAPAVRGGVATDDLAELAQYCRCWLVVPAQFLGATLGSGVCLAARPRALRQGDRGRKRPAVMRRWPRSRRCRGGDCGAFGGATFAQVAWACRPRYLACAGAGAVGAMAPKKTGRPTSPLLLRRRDRSGDRWAVKNVLAIACGVVEGLGLGKGNARGADRARPCQMLRFGLMLGAPGRDRSRACRGWATLSSICASTASRNYAAGQGPA